MSLTEEQRRAVDASGSVVVVAGAGTGKTHMLTGRYLHHLSEDGLSPLEVVAVTFTEKASDELRSRVRERVRGQLAAREDLLAELEAAQISTIHALCARVCREHPEEAGVPPDFGILDELRGQLWMADRLADAMDGLPQEHYRVVPYPLMQAALEALLSDPLAAAEALAKGPEGWRDLIEEARESALSEYLDEPVLKEARWTLELCEGDDGDRMEESRRGALSALEELEELETSENHKSAFELLASIDLRGGKKGAWSDGELASVKEALRLVRELARAELRRGIVVLPANLELLLEAPAETPRLRAFEQTVLDVSFEASRTLRDQVAAAAEDLEARSPVTAVMSEESSVVSESEIVPDSEWLPLCGQPDKLYMVYADEGTDTMLGSTHLMGQKDLQRLQVPSGLPRGVFEKYVGAIIQQTPLVQQIREAAAGGRVTPQAGQDILTSLVDGQHLKHGPKARWETVRNWLLYFLPQEYRRPHGSDDLQRGVQIGSWPA